MARIREEYAMSKETPLARLKRLTVVFNLFMLIAIAVTLLQSYNLSQLIQNNHTAEETLEQIRTVVYQKERSPSSLMFFNINNTATLPSPLNQIKLPYKTKINYLVALDRGGKRIVLIGVSHKEGNLLYRWSDIYSEKRIQKIAIT